MKWIIIAFMMLAGCETTAPAVRVEVQRVEVPVPVSCWSGELPKEPARVGKLSGNAEVDIGPIAASALRLWAYAAELRAMLLGCKSD